MPRFHDEQYTNEASAMPESAAAQGLDTSACLLRKFSEHEHAEVVIDLAAATYLLSHCDRIKQEHAPGGINAIPSLPAEALKSSVLLPPKGPLRANDYQAWVDSLHGTRSYLPNLWLADPATLPPGVGRRPIGTPLSLRAEVCPHTGVCFFYLETRRKHRKGACSIPVFEGCLRVVQARAALLSGDPTYQRFFDHQDSQIRAWSVSALARSIVPERLPSLSAERLGLILPPLFSSGDEKVRDFATELLALRRRHDPPHREDHRDRTSTQAR